MHNGETHKCSFCFRCHCFHKLIGFLAFPIFLPLLKEMDFLVGDVFKPDVGDIFDAMGIVEPPMDEPPKAAAMA